MTDGGLRCRFCGKEFPRTSNGKLQWGQLKMHMNKHKDAQQKIVEHLNAREAPLDLKRSGTRRGSASQSFGAEYRKTLGYATSASGAEQRKDDDE